MDMPWLKKPNLPLFLVIVSIGIIVAGSAIAYFSYFGFPGKYQVQENPKFSQSKTTLPALQMDEVNKIVQKGFDNRRQKGSGEPDYEVKSFTDFQEYFFSSDEESFKFILAVAQLEGSEDPQQHSGVRVVDSLPLVVVGFYEIDDNSWTMVDALILESTSETDTISAELIKIGPDKQGLLVSRQNEPSENPLLVSRFNQLIAYVHDNQLQMVRTVHRENNDADYGCLKPETPTSQAAERDYYPCFHYESTLEFSSTTLSAGYYDFTVRYTGTSLDYNQANAIVPMNYSATYSFDSVNESYRDK